MRLSFDLLVPGFICLIAVSLACGARAGEVGPGVRETLAEQGTARVIVTFGVPEDRTLGLDERLASVHARRAELLGDIPGDSVRVSRRWRAIHGFAAEVDGDGLEALLSHPGRVRIDLDPPVRAHLATSVPQIGADRAHELGITGEGVIVAVLDTGINADHPDLSDDLILEQCFCVNYIGENCCVGDTPEASGPGSAGGNHAHGTHVTGIVTSKGEIAWPGVAPDAEIVAVKVLDDSIHSVVASNSLTALDWILTEHREVDLVNMSLGTSATYPTPCDDMDATTEAYAEVVEALRQEGIVVFTSSGNEASTDGLGRPACIEGMVSVGAVYDTELNWQLSFDDCVDDSASTDQIICFSNVDPELDMLAPGGPTNSCYGDATDTMYGTSMACPHAVGVAALLLQLDPSLTPHQIETLLEDTGVPIEDTRVGLTFPRVDAAASLSTLLDETCDDGLDDDLDGLADCADPDCEGASDGGGVSCEPGGEESCDDEADNDGNGAVDCEDDACASSPECGTGGCACGAGERRSEGAGAGLAALLAALWLARRYSIRTRVT